MSRLVRRARVAIAAIAFAAASLAHGAEPTANTGPAATVQQFIASFNAGDVDAARATHVAEPTIVDEVPPYLWQGKGAFDNWLASLASHDTAEGVTDQSMQLGDAIREETSGGDAYLVVRSIYSFKQKGIEMAAQGHMTFALRNAGGGWRITAWTYSAPRATAVEM
jgi:hypothetical protein